MPTNSYKPLIIRYLFQNISKYFKIFRDMIEPAIGNFIQSLDP